MYVSKYTFPREAYEALRPLQSLELRGIWALGPGGARGALGGPGGALGRAWICTGGALVYPSTLGRSVRALGLDRVYPIPLTPFPMDPPPAKCEKTRKNSYLLHKCVKMPNAEGVSLVTRLTPPKISHVLLGFNLDVNE